MFMETLSMLTALWMIGAIVNASPVPTTVIGTSITSPLIFKRTGGPLTPVKSWYQEGGDFIRFRVSFSGADYTCDDLSSALTSYSYPLVPPSHYQNIQCWEHDDDTNTWELDVSAYNNGQSPVVTMCGVSKAVDPSQPFCFDETCCTFDQAKQDIPSLSRRTAVVRDDRDFDAGIQAGEYDMDPTDFAEGAAEY